MIYNKNCGPVAIKTKRTMRLSRGFLAFVFIFGLSAALTAEAGKKTSPKTSPKTREKVRRQATGQRPIRQRQSIAKDHWSEVVKASDLNPSDKAFSRAFQTLATRHKENLEGFLKDVAELVKKPEYRFEESGRYFLFRSVIDSIVMSVKNNNGSGDRVLLLNLVVLMKKYLDSYPHIGDGRLRKIRSVVGFLNELPPAIQVLQLQKKDASFAEIKEEARIRYNDSLRYFLNETNGEFLLKNWYFDLLREEKGKLY